MVVGVGVRNGGGRKFVCLLGLRLNICHVLSLFFLHVAEPRYWRFYLDLCSLFNGKLVKNILPLSMF